MKLYRRPLLHSMLGLFAPVAALAAGKNCDICREAIEGSYTSYRIHGSRLEVCANCERNKPRCDACSIPHNKQNLRLHKGERICRICLPHVEYCHICDDRITGKFIAFGKGSNKKNICGTCYNTHPKCPACGVPHPKNQLDRSTGVCQSCNKTLERCGSCEEPVYGRFYKYEFTDHVYCSECHNNKPHCYTCSLPVGKIFWEFQDGREICDTCNRRAVYDEKQIRTIMEESKTLVHRFVGIQAMRPYELHVEQLNAKSANDAKKAKSGETSDSPLYGSELGLYRSSGTKSEIFLLYGLPIEMIYETAAHEYAHAWQAENSPPNQSSELREGFAQWVGAKILSAKGYKEALQRLEARRDHPYGTGYHKIKSIEDRYGRAKVIEHIKTAVR